MSDILKKIVESKRQDIEDLYSGKGLSFYKEEAESCVGVQPMFYSNLMEPGLSLIAEIKKASPSKGIIRHDFNPVELAKTFVDQGATALSVLTEIHFFQGSPDYIKLVKDTVDVPILRKDFIIDPIQVYESKYLGVDAILLIKSILSDSECQKLLALARSISLDVLLEVHNEEELSACVGMDGIQLIGVNNRNLVDFSVDLGLSSRLYDVINSSCGDDVGVVAESGYSQKEELHALDQQGVEAVLIGEGLATYPDLLSYWGR